MLQFWLVNVYSWAQLDSERDPTKAEVVLVKPLHVQNAKYYKCFVQKNTSSSSNSSKAKSNLKSNLEEEEERDAIWFEFWNARYVYERSSGRFLRLTYPVEGTPFSDHLKVSGYGSQKKVEKALDKWGTNEFTFYKPEFLPLLIEHMLAPFFIFQLFCVGLWCLDEYWYYSLFTLVMLVLFESTVAKQRLRNLDTLQQMGHKPQTIWTNRDGKWINISEQLLLPGDIISISSESGFYETFVPADCLLLAGTGITNESILTGESAPQWKVAIKFRNPKDTFSWKKDKQHVLFRGTTLIQHETDTCSHLSPHLRGRKTPNGGMLCEVLRTGFSTTQGDLMRTILHSTERMSANSSEAGLFILFLLNFAVAASGYVLYHGIYLTDPNKRDFFKLALNCVMIITSVIPPELPMELSLAVNTSMLSLFKKFIFCTEPFRIPFAGKVDACCFDKTGTLTSTRLKFEGVGDPCGFSDLGSAVSDLEMPLSPQSDAIKVLVGCHSLVAVDGKLRGDPMEKAAFKALSWTITKDNMAKPRKINTMITGKDRFMLKIVKRFHFNPVLKRMSTIAKVEPMEASLGEGGPMSGFIVLTKGAPESLKGCFAKTPRNYDEVYMSYARRGLRVIALGIKRMKSVTDMSVARTIPRAQAEVELDFCGFAVFSCPLKASSSETLLSLRQACHRLVMITGDAMLTACHVAQEVHIADKTPLILDEKKGRPFLQDRLSFSDVESVFEWISHDGSTDIAFNVDSVAELAKDYTLCVPGKAVNLLTKAGSKALQCVLPYCSVFARTSPDDKEVIVKTLKDVGHTVLMCGDGTNDVGALKSAHVGIALLNSKPIKFKKPKKKKNKNLGEWIKELEEEEDDSLPVVSLGDASIASPFTSRFSTVTPCLDIVKQGRSTLVTYVQMFKILGINCLSSAYSMSVMYLNGVKVGDTQATISGIIIAFLFMFLSNSSPHEKLSSKRPHSKVFCKYFIVSMIGQFLLHFLFLYGSYQYSLTFQVDEDLERQICLRAGVVSQSQCDATTLSDVLREAQRLAQGIAESKVDFQPTLVNTVAFLVNFMVQLSTFAVNYVGEPFNASIWKNRGLIYGLLACSLLSGLLISGVDEDINATFEIVSLPKEMKLLLSVGGITTWLLCMALERAARLMFPEKIHKNLLI